MIDSYSFVFWFHDGNLSVEQTSYIVCNVASILERQIGCPVLNYETAYSKSKARPVVISQEYMLQKLERMRKKQDSFPRFTFGFFSSKDDSKSIGIRFSLGGYHHLFSNVVTIEFPPEYTKLQSNFPALWTMFRELTGALEPYYAFMPNNLSLGGLIESYWNRKNGKPTCIHTFNYFDRDTMQSIGEDRILCEPNIETAENGVFLKLLPEPLSVENPEHLQLQREISKRLGLM